MDSARSLIATAAQIDYYRAASGEYDLSYPADSGPLRDADRALEFIGVRGHTVELACGTGQWSRLLEPRVTTLTCVDAAPETLAIARTRVGSAVEFLTADVFTWDAPRVYDSVFFSFWLSHVPWDLWPAFWARVEQILAPGGVVGVIDETASGVAEKESWTSEPDIAVRTLSDAREFPIVKLRLEPDDVMQRLAALGWAAETDSFHEGMFALRAYKAAGAGGPQAYDDFGPRR